MASVMNSPYSSPNSPIASAKRTPSRSNKTASQKSSTTKDKSGSVFSYLANLTGLFSPKPQGGAVDNDDTNISSLNINTSDSVPMSPGGVMPKYSADDRIKINKDRNSPESEVGTSTTGSTSHEEDDSLEDSPGKSSSIDDEEPDNDDETYDEDAFNPYLYMATLPPLSTLARHKPALPLKSSNDKKFTLTLDLDETLVHCSVEPIPKADCVFPVTFNGMAYQIYARKRPYLEYFLETVSKDFEVVVFTASQSIYADKLLNYIDPTGTLIKYRLFRESCVCVQGNYVKDLQVLGRDLETTVLVDNSPHAYAYNIENGIPIESWFDDESDTELLKLVGFLRKFNELDDVRPLITSHFKTSKLIRNARLGKRPPTVSPPF